MYKKFFPLMIILFLTLNTVHAQVKDATSLVERVVNEINASCIDILSILRTNSDNEYKSEKIVKIASKVNYSPYSLSFFIEGTLNPKITRLHKLSKNLKKQRRLTVNLQTKINTLTQELKTIVSLIQNNKLFLKPPYFELRLGKLFCISVREANPELS